MTGAVCEVARYPSSSMTKQVGEIINYFLSIKNCGNTSENFFYLIKKNGSTIKSRYNHQLSPGVKGSLLSGSITMGSSSVKFDFIAGFAVGGSWVTKYSRSATISPGIQYAYFKVYVRAQNNSQPISGAKVVCSGVTKYTGSDGYTSSFRTVMFTTVSYTVSKTGYQSVSRSCYINRDNDLCTPYLSPICTCGPWISGECMRDNYRRQTRTCSPSGCDNEWREVYDPSCVLCSCDSWVNKECVRENYRQQTRTCTPAGCDVETREIYDTTCKLGAAKGEITLCNMNELSCPNCGLAPPGKEIIVIAEMKNIGDELGEFRFYIRDKDTGAILSKEPDLTYKNVAAGETWRVVKSLLVNLNFNMPNKKFNGLLEIIRQT